MPLPLEKVSFRSHRTGSGLRTPFRIPVIAGFLIWTLLYVVKNSYVAPDGHRYYWLFDDAMISMRYAWNLAHGMGLVWNPGEPVEGYSNLLATLLMSVTHLLASLRFAPLLVICGNVAAALLAAHVLLSLMDDLAVEHTLPPLQLAWAQDIALFFLLSYYPFVYWTVAGMETTLLTLWLLLAARNLLTPVNVAYPWFRDVSLGLMLAAAYLTRPDSLLYLLPLLGCLLWLSWNSWPRRRPFLVGGFLLAAIVGQVLFRKAYYGEWLPNTYYLKATGLGFWAAAKNGAAYLLPFFGETAFLWILLLLSVPFGPFPMASLLAFFLGGLGLGYHLWIGGDAFIGLWRLLVPILPFLFAAVAFFLARLLDERLPFTPKQKPFAAMAIVLALGLWQNKAFLPWLILKDTPGRKINQHFVETAIALDDILKPGASVGVFSAGVLPYYLPHLRAVDFLGKCDKYIARTAPHFVEVKGLPTHPGHNKYDLKYSVLKLKPTYIEQAKWYDDDVSKEATALYLGIPYRGKVLYLLKTSPAVHWERLK